jgi:hypothetical protein
VLRAHDPNDPLLSQAGTATAQRNKDFLHGGHFQSQFFGIEQQWRRLQTAAVSTSPLEQAILDIQRRMDQLVINDGALQVRVANPPEPPRPPLG